jgi:hypothetical protein
MPVGAYAFSINTTIFSLPLSLAFRFSNMLTTLYPTTSLSVSCFACSSSPFPLMKMYDSSV